MDCPVFLSFIATPKQTLDMSQTDRSDLSLLVGTLSQDYGRLLLLGVLLWAIVSPIISRLGRDISRLNQFLVLILFAAAIGCVFIGVYMINREKKVWIVPRLIASGIIIVIITTILGTRLLGYTQDRLMFESLLGIILFMGTGILLSGVLATFAFVTAYIRHGPSGRKENDLIDPPDDF